MASAGLTKDGKLRKRSSVPPVTLRLTPDERERLEELAAGMTLSAYIRACVFAKEERRRKRRSKNAVADKKAIAEALALMGQSRIANNLNQLAHQANIGALDMDEDTRGQIDEAYLFIAEMRGMLVKALRSGA
ncbi:plasmid mobilization protein [Shimia aestuarii]|uniref:plasmid mobilization protein n=1 Tax=Shimia aestuarii TaxID=254406 RepID=UPI001FB4CD77|nr:plasmid mobilization relaxosome protein MobC [Shimia aestuarii]